MYKDIEFIKYCCKNSVNIALVSVDGERRIFIHQSENDVIVESCRLDTWQWKDIYFPLLLSRTCDALGICIVPTSTKNNWYSELDCSDDEHATADEARIAAIKKYMEVEG